MRIPDSAHIFDRSIKTILITETRIKQKEPHENLILEVIDFSKNCANQICKVLQKHQIESLIVEGGLQTLQTFIDENLWDEAAVFVAEKEFQNGVESPRLKKGLKEVINIKTDVLKRYKND